MPGFTRYNGDSYIFRAWTDESQLTPDATFLEDRGKVLVPSRVWWDDAASAMDTSPQMLQDVKLRHLQITFNGGSGYVDIHAGSAETEYVWPHDPINKVVGPNHLRPIFNGVVNHTLNIIQQRANVIQMAISSYAAPYSEYAADAAITNASMYITILFQNSLWAEDSNYGDTESIQDHLQTLIRTSGVNDDGTDIGANLADLSQTVVLESGMMFVPSNEYYAY